MSKKRIFISSVQKEFAEERKRLFDYLMDDPILSKFFVPFIFEDYPATGRSTSTVYLKEVEKSDIYLGILVTNTASKTRLGFPQRNRNTPSPTNYTSNASVQVMLFKNRLEIWNPGQLPYELTTQQLYKPHKSHPNNPLIAEPLQRSGFIEKAETGTGEI